MLDALQVIGALILIFFLPGIMLVQALFPRQGELDPDFDTTAMDNVLSKAGLPPLEKIMEAWEDSTEREKKWKSSAASEMADKEKALAESERLSEELRELAIKAQQLPRLPVSVYRD